MLAGLLIVRRVAVIKGAGETVVTRRRNVVASAAAPVLLAGLIGGAGVAVVTGLALDGSVDAGVAVGVGITAVECAGVGVVAGEGLFSLTDPSLAVAGRADGARVAVIAGLAGHRLVFARRVGI